MSFINLLSEKLESRVYDGLRGKYESRFRVEGVEYAFIAISDAGDCEDTNASWMLEFENTLSHRISVGDNNPKVVKAFGEVVGEWVKVKNPHCFYTYGSHIDSLKSIIETVKKKVKGYNLIDDTAEKKNEDIGEVIEGNPIGKITWTKMVEQEATPSEKIANTKQDDFEKTYEEPKDVKTNKEYMSGTSKTDKLDKGDKAYGLKTESINVDDYVKKFKDKMKGSSKKTAIGWVDGIKGISKSDKEKIKKKLGLPVKKEESFAEFKARMLNEESYDEFESDDLEPVEPEDDDCFYSPSGSLGSKTSVRCGGDFIGEFNSDEEALEAIRNWQDKHQWWPNIWFVSDHGNVILVDKEGNEIKESIQEGVGNLAKLASAAIRKLSEKVKGAWKKVTEIAGSEESLKRWVDENKEELAHAMDIAKHMMDKKQLTFEGKEVSYSMLQENLLDLVAQKTPNVLAAAILILSVMGSGQKVFGANDSGSDAISKIKQNAKAIVEIVKHQGDQFGKNVIKDIDKAKKDAAKEAKAKVSELKDKATEKGKEVSNKAKEFGKKAGEKADELRPEIQKKAGEAGEDLKKGFQNFLQKKKSEQKPKFEPVKPKMPTIEI